jgi:triacylglycerol lipase
VVPTGGVVLGVAVGALALAAGLSGADSSATDRQPVLFVHGYAADPSMWDGMADRFRAAGYRDDELHRLGYDATRSNRETAELVAREADRLRAATGWDSVDVVTHSMGGLPTRYWIARLDGAPLVESWVSLGGPNRGGTSGFDCDDAACRERRVGSDFLADLNRDDPTPGAVRYATWWSPCDEIVEPRTSVVLRGAANSRTGCLSHAGLATDPAVAAEVVDFVSAEPSGRGRR